MNKTRLNTISTIIGILSAIYGFINSNNLALILGPGMAIVVFILGEEIIGLFKDKKNTKSAQISIRGLNISSLNLANLERLNDKYFKVTSAKHKAIIKGNDAIFFFQYSGNCIETPPENGFYFSLDADVNTPFNDLKCIGYDLINDPDKLKPKIPTLKKSDGLTRKVLLPFEKQILQHLPFDVSLEVEFKNCMSFDKDYYTATLSFNKNHQIDNFTAELEFQDHKPIYNELYEVKYGRVRLINSLSPKYEDEDSAYYIDEHSKCKGQRQLVYFFQRKK